jgi:hypothetical protein
MVGVDASDSVSFQCCPALGSTGGAKLAADSRADRAPPSPARGGGGRRGRLAALLALGQEAAPAQEESAGGAAPEEADEHPRAGPRGRGPTGRVLPDQKPWVSFGRHPRAGRFRAPLLSRRHRAARHTPAGPPEGAPCGGPCLAVANPRRLPKPSPALPAC